MKQKLVTLAMLLSCIFYMTGCFGTIQQTSEEKKAIFSPTDDDVGIIFINDKQLNNIRRVWGPARVNSTTQAIQSHNYSIKIGERTKALEEKTDKLETEASKFKSDIKDLQLKVDKLEQKQKIAPVKKPLAPKLKGPPV